MDTFVGREDPVSKIQAELAAIASDRQLHILSISGPGGVGKTFLLEYALSQLDLDHLGYLCLRVDGNTSSVTLADVLVRDLIGTLPVSIAGDPAYFRVTCKGYDLLQRMDEAARAELEGDAKGDDALAKMIGVTYDGVVGLLEVVSPSRAWKVTRIVKRIRGKNLERVITAIRGAKAYHKERSFLGFLPLRAAAKERNLLRKDLQGRLAEYLRIDLEAILSGHRPQDWKRYLPSKVKGLDHCLMIFDDYETLASTIDDFLRHELLPRLRKTRFTTTIIILGRDSIRDVDFAWDQYFGKDIVLDLRLTPLSEEESQHYLVARGIADPSVRNRIVRDSLGMPFLLAAEAECELRGGGSALSLQKFVDRTTRWMSPEQKAWCFALAFLDEVNADTVKCMLPDADPDGVLGWFKREASIRSPETEKWRMLPIIRSRLKASLRNDSPSEYTAYRDAAAKACGAVE